MATNLEIAQWLEFALSSHKRAANTSKHQTLKNFHEGEVKKINLFMNEITRPEALPIEEYIQKNISKKDK